MTFPKKVTISGREWDIHKASAEAFEGYLGPSPGVDGLCVENDQIILVAANMHPQRQRLVTLHECIHAATGRAFAQLGIRDKDKELEESMVSIMADAVDAILADNPAIVRLYQKGS